MQNWSPLTPGAQRMFGPGVGLPTDFMNVARNLVAEGNPQPQQQQQQAPAQTSGGGGGGSYGYAAPNYNSQAIAALRQSMNRLGEQEGYFRQDLENQYGVQRAKTDLSRGQGMQNLQSQREKTTRQKDMSIRDLANNIRNAYQSGLINLGIGGGGSSSAQEAMRFALGQQEGKNRSQLLSDFNYNIGNIDQATTQLEQNYQQSLRELDQWKNSKALEIATNFQNRRDQINQQLAGMGAATVSQAQSELMAQTARDLANLSVNVNDYKGALNDQLSKAAAQLREYNIGNVYTDTSIKRNAPTAPVLTPLYRRPEEE